MKIFFIIILINISALGIAKPRTVYLQKELDNAEIIQYAVVIDYQETILKLKLSETGETIECNVYARMSKIDDFLSNQLTGLIPQIGEEILVVIDKNKELSLIAKQIDNNFLRFWSPRETGSIAEFYFNEPAKPMPRGKEIVNININYIGFWDGCLFPIIDLITT